MLEQQTDVNIYMTPAANADYHGVSIMIVCINFETLMMLMFAGTTMRQPIITDECPPEPIKEKENKTGMAPD